MVSRNVDETRLPGVGIRHDFVTSGGTRIGMLSHLSGRRELLIYDENDPDSCRETIELDPDDTRVLAELLGADHIAEHLSEIHQSLRGLVIEWLTVEGSASTDGLTIAALAETGVSVVAVICKGELVPAPGPDFRLGVGDTAVVLATPEAIGRALALVRGD